MAALGKSFERRVTDSVAVRSVEFLELSVSLSYCLDYRVPDSTVRDAELVNLRVTFDDRRHRRSLIKSQ